MSKYESEDKVLFNYLKNLNDLGYLHPLLEVSDEFVHPLNDRFNKQFEYFFADIIRGKPNKIYWDKYAITNKEEDKIEAINNDREHGDVYLRIPFYENKYYKYEIDIKVSETIKFVGSISDKSITTFRGWYFLFSKNRKKLIVLSAYDLYRYLIHGSKEIYLGIGISDNNLKKWLDYSNIRYEIFYIN